LPCHQLTAYRLPCHHQLTAYRLPCHQLTAYLSMYQLLIDCHVIIN
jgi:hypothetical protein